MINTTPSYRPKCPNHGVSLDGCGFPLPKKGTGICPVSGCPFDFEVDIDTQSAKLAKDKDGNIKGGTDWKVTGSD